MAIEYNFTLDMDRSKRDNNIAYARTGDMDSIVINADLVFGGAAYTPSGTNAFFECITPNGRSIRAAAEKTGSSVSVEVPSAAFQAAGVINVAYFRFESGASDNPTYVESTEPFAIVVREGIGDNIDAGDYIEEWRKLADQLEAAVAEVEKKAEQAETAINEQKTEVDQLKAQAQVSIAGDVTEVEGVAQSAITAINKEKADVANAAEGITEAGEQAINSFYSKGTSAIDKFNTDSASAINQFNTNAGSKLDEVDGMITEAQGDVDAAITQLEDKTQDAIDAAQDALDGTIATNLQNAINRTLKLDVADMTNIPDNSSLSSFTNVGSYCCKTAATAATVGDCPIDGSPFNMYVFSSSTSGQVMQLVVPIDLNGKPTAEWHVRFGTSSAMDPWSVIGGGADIAAGLGIDVIGDAQKTVALDTTAFYKHHEAADIIQGSTEVTGGGRIKELRVKGRTVKNLWPVINKSDEGITASTDGTGLVTITGTTAGHSAYLDGLVTGVVPGRTVTLLISKAIGGSTGLTQVYLKFIDSSGIQIPENGWVGITTATTTTTTTTTIPEGTASVYCGFETVQNGDVNWSGRVMLVEGTEVPDCFTPPASITSVQPGNLVTSGKNLLSDAILQQVAASQSPSIEYADGVMTVNFNNGATWNTVPTVMTVPPGDYVASFAGSSVIIEVGDGTDEIVTSVGDNFVNFSLKVETSLSFKFISIDPKALPGTITNIQLELGSTATAYEPPSITTTPLPEVELRSLPNGTCDELVIGADGTCRVERRTQLVDGEVVAIGTPTTEPQPPVTLPALPVPGYTVYASSNVLAEIEAEVVKVDYLPLSDVYTREEVDRKIEDAGMPAVVPVSKGGTGVTTAAAERNRLGLGNTTGALPVANGGTGATAAKVAQYNLLNSINSEDGNIGDSSLFAFAYTSPSSTTGVLYKRNGTNVWNWIVSKIRSTFGFNASNVLPVTNGGTGSTSAKAAQNSLLNDMNESSDVLTDSSMLVGYNASPSASNGAVHKRSVSTVWDYIASKVADKVWDQIKTKAVRSDTTTGTDLTLVGGLESMSQASTSTLTLGINEMSLDNSNAVPFTVNGEEVITEGNISSHLPATFDAKSVWFSTPLTKGQQKNIITEGGFTLEDLRKYFVPGNLVLANIACVDAHNVQRVVVVPMVITLGDEMVTQPTGTFYNSAANAHYECVFAVANNEQAGDGGGSVLADGVTMLYSVTEVPGHTDLTSSSSLRGFTVFDVVSHAI